MASIAGWWAIPAVALLVIVLWTSWRGRTRKPQGMHDTVAHYERFQAVLTRVVEADPRAQGDPNADEPRAAGRRDVP
ncbi:hypothetical protein OG216_29340 [Streptomycetaceae bacterium NBC_01309]